MRNLPSAKGDDVSRGQNEPIMTWYEAKFENSISFSVFDRVYGVLRGPPSSNPQENSARGRVLKSFLEFQLF